VSLTRRVAQSWWWNTLS